MEPDQHIHGKHPLKNEVLFKQHESLTFLKDINLKMTIVRDNSVIGRVLT